MNKGFKSIADIAKPKMNTAVKQALKASPLDACMTGSARAREDSKRALAEGEINLTKMYARDHDGMVTARALLVGATKALTRMMAAAEALEVEAAKARAQLQSDQNALQVANTTSITVLTAERDMMMRCLCNELRTIETDSNFSLQTLLHQLDKTQGSMAAQGYQLSGKLEQTGSELEKARQLHAETSEAAEKKETRLAQEIARLCGVVDKLKGEMAKERQEHAAMHAEVIKTMSGQLADKQRTIDDREMEIRELEAKLDGTSATLTNQLRDLAKEKETREQRLREENAQAVERGRRASMQFGQQLSALKAEKEAREAKLAQDLESEKANAEKQASALAQKIEKMRKLQELALGGVGGGGSADAGGSGDASARSGPSTRGRQLLYWESLKSKTQDSPSMSWRGNNEFAHEVPPGSARQEEARQQGGGGGRRVSTTPRR